MQIPGSNDEMAEGKKEKAQRGDNDIKEKDATIPQKEAKLMESPQNVEIPVRGLSKRRS